MNIDYVRQDCVNGKQGNEYEAFSVSVYKTRKSIFRIDRSLYII